MSRVMQVRWFLQQMKRQMKWVTRKMHSTRCPCDMTSGRWCRHKKGDILEKAFSNSFSCMEIVAFKFRFHRNLFQSIPIKQWTSIVRHQHIMWSNGGLVVPSLMGWGLAHVIWHHVCGTINRPWFICSIHRFVESGLSQWKLMLHAWHLWEDTRSAYLSKATIQITILADHKRHIKIKYVTWRL